MKKKVLLAMAVIMVLGSVKAMALTAEEENQFTKIEAVEAMNAEMSGEAEISQVDGAIMAKQIMDIEDVNKEVQGLIDRLGEEGSGLQQSSLGQMSFLADSYEQQAKATQNVDKVNELWEQAMDLKGKVSKIKANQ